MEYRIRYDETRGKYVGEVFDTLQSDPWVAVVACSTETAVREHMRKNYSDILEIRFA